MRRSMVAAGLLLAGLAVVAGCAVAPSPRPAVPFIVWPKPPEIPRVSFVRAVSLPEDMGIVEGPASGFLRFLAGTRRVPLTSPHGVAVDAEGRMYVVDNFLRKVHAFDLPGNRHFTFPEKGLALVSPIGIAVDGRRGRIYVSDSVDAVVRVFDREGVELSRGLRTGAMGRPTGIAINAATDELLVVDTVNANILRFSLEDGGLKAIMGTRGDQPGAFHAPTHVAVSRSGEFLVTDSLNHRVQAFSAQGAFLRAFGAAGDSPGYFSRPKGVAADSDGNVYVVDALFDNVQVFDAKGALLMAFGGPGAAPGEFWLPSGIFVDDKDMIYLSDSYNKRVQVFQYLRNGEPR